MTRNKRITPTERQRIIAARRQARFIGDPILVNREIRRVSR